MNPIRSYTMLNFIHWLAIHHPEIKQISDQPEYILLRLVNEFEKGKLDGNLKLTQKWKAGFDFLLNRSGSWDGYDEVRRELAHIEVRK